MRKLAHSSIAFAAAIFAAHYAIPPEWLPACAAVFGALALILVLARLHGCLNYPVLLLCAAAGFACCWAQYRLTIAPAEKLAGQTVTVEATVTTFPAVYDDRTVLDVRLSGTAQGVNARISDYDGFSTENLRPGDTMNVTVKFSSASMRYGEKTDAYLSRSIFAVGYVQSAPNDVNRGMWAWIYFPQYAAEWIKNAVGTVFPADTAPFMKALLTGDKADFYLDGGTYVNMRSSGLVHVVAVSGLHVAFLVGFLQLIMGRNRRSSMLCLALVWLFVVMTGGTPSTVRAGVMQSMLLIAPLVGRENDSPTSLFFALAVILLGSPSEAGSAALQLSFAAMAGIMLVSPAIYSRMTAGESKRLIRLKSYVAGVIASSIGAIVFTAPILAVRFGYVPILSPVTNLLCLWAVTGCFCGGFIACGLSVISVLGKAAAWLASWLVRYILLVCGLVAKIPFTAIYTGNSLVCWWLILVYVIFLITYLGKKDGAFRWVIPTALSAATLCAVIITTAVCYSTGGYITAIDVGQGQCLAVFSGRDTVVIDCGGKNTLNNAGDTAAAYLLSCGRKQVDALILTHLHSDHANGVARLMQTMAVKTLVLPYGADDDDEMLPEILSAAESAGTEIKYIARDSQLSAGNITTSLYAPPDKGTANEKGLSMTVSVGDYDMIVTGDMNRTAEKAVIASRDLSGAELIIAGHHGSAYSTSSELLEECGAKTAIISVGYNSYGHPSNEALGRLQRAGATVYRTDLNGNITVKVG